MNQRREFEQLIRQQFIPVNNNNNNKNNYQHNEVVPLQQEQSVFEKLGYHLHKQFLAGNITNEFKIIIKSFSEQDLKFLEIYARKHNKQKMADYLNSEINSKNNLISIVPSAPPV